MLGRRTGRMVAEEGREYSSDDRFSGARLLHTTDGSGSLQTQQSNIILPCFRIVARVNAHFSNHYRISNIAHIRSAQSYSNRNWFTTIGYIQSIGINSFEFDNLQDQTTCRCHDEVYGNQGSTTPSRTDWSLYDDSGSIWDISWQHHLTARNSLTGFFDQ